MLVKSINSSEVVAGKLLNFLIPKRTFYDHEDGDTRNLQLSLNITSVGLPSQCWFTFNSSTQTLYGLPYTELLGNKDRLTVNYQLTATDSCGLSSVDNFAIILQKPVRHCFEMTIAFKTRKLYECEWVAVKEFLNRVAAYYGYDASKDISVVEYVRSKKFYDRLSVKISFSQSIIKCDICDSIAIANITYRVLHENNFTVHRDFNAFLSPSFEAINVLVTGVDTCAAYILPFTQEKGSSLPILAWLIPVIIFSVGLILTCLIALCRYCRCCSCCFCLFPVDEDEDYFMRKECPPRRHRTYREFVGSDFDQSYPSMRKNRAGQMPDDTSIESADDVIENGSDDGILPPPPFPRKKESPANSGENTESEGSVGVTTIVYATPPIGKECTELSVFSTGGDSLGNKGEGVNVVYHNISETSFQECDDEECERTHGSFESLILRRANSTGNIVNESLNEGIRDSVIVDLDQGKSTGNTIQAGTLNSAVMISQTKNERGNHACQGSALDTLQNQVIDPPYLFDKGGGVINSGFQGEDVAWNGGSTTVNGSAMVIRSMNQNENHSTESRLSFEGDISNINGERNISLASNCVEAKQAANHLQSSVTGRAVMYGDGENMEVENNKTTITKRRNAFKANSSVHPVIPGVNDDGLLVDAKGSNQSKSWATFESTNNGDTRETNGSNDVSIRVSSSCNNQSSANISLMSMEAENDEQRGNGTCRVHLSSDNHHGQIQRAETTNEQIKGKDVSNDLKMCKMCCPCAMHGCKHMDQSKLSQACLGCNPHVPCNTNSEITCLVGHSKHCSNAGHVSCSGMVQMNSNNQSRYDSCSNVTVNCDKHQVEEKSFSRTTCSHLMIKDAEITHQDECKCNADMQCLHKSIPAVSTGICNVCKMPMNDVIAATNDESKRTIGNARNRVEGLIPGNEQNHFQNTVCVDQSANQEGVVTGITVLKKVRISLCVL